MRWVAAASLIVSVALADEPLKPIHKCLLADYCIKVIGPADTFEFEVVRGDDGKVEYLTIETRDAMSLDSVTESELFYQTLDAALLLGVITRDDADVILIRHGIGKAIEEKIEDGTWRQND